MRFLYIFIVLLFGCEIKQKRDSEIINSHDSKANTLNQRISELIADHALEDNDSIKGILLDSLQQLAAKAYQEDSTDFLSIYNSYLIAELSDNYLDETKFLKKLYNNSQNPLFLIRLAFILKEKNELYVNHLKQAEEQLDSLISKEHNNLDYRLYAVYLECIKGKDVEAVIADLDSILIEFPEDSLVINHNKKLLSNGCDNLFLYRICIACPHNHIIKPDQNVVGQVLCSIASTAT